MLSVVDNRPPQRLRYVMCSLFVMISVVIYIYFPIFLVIHEIVRHEAAGSLFFFVICVYTQRTAMSSLPAPIIANVLTMIQSSRLLHFPSSKQQK